MEWTRCRLSYDVVFLDNATRYFEQWLTSSASSVNAIWTRCTVIVGYEFEKATTLKYDRRSVGRSRLAASLGCGRDSGQTGVVTGTPERRWGTRRKERCRRCYRRIDCGVVMVHWAHRGCAAARWWVAAAVIERFSVSLHTRRRTYRCQLASFHPHYDHTDVLPFVLRFSVFLP